MAKMKAQGGAGPPPGAATEKPDGADGAPRPAPAERPAT
jgi:hypothetical protein